MEQEERLLPVHPGEALLEDFMKPLGLSQYRLAQDLNVPAIRINQIVHGKRAITADTALRLARYFGTSPHVWMRLQARYDLEVAESGLAERVRREVKVRPSTGMPTAFEDAGQMSQMSHGLAVRETTSSYEDIDEDIDL